MSITSAEVRRSRSAQDVAEALDLHEKTVLRHIREGRIHAVRIGGRWRIPAAEVDRLLGL